MTVRADGIALGDLLQDALRASTTDHAGHRGPLRLGLTMVEIHRTWRETMPAVAAGHVTELIEHASLAPPDLALPSELCGVAGSRHGTSRVSQLSAYPMTVRTDHVAFRRLVAKGRLRAQHGPTRRESKSFGRPLPMVEVHLVRSERQSAVGARALPQAAQELERSLLPDTDTIDLEGSVPFVVVAIR
jgi:hypothetical protein